MQNPNDELKCSKCGIAFSSRKELKKHVMKIHGEGPHQCHECGKCFLQPTSLQGHIGRRHTGEAKYKCIKCDKTFRTNRHRREHMTTHYQCSICDKAYFTSKDLQMHMDSHTNEKNKYCSECDETFPTHHLYLQDKKKHTKESRKQAGENPHQCMCGKRFKNKLILKMHKKTQHTKKLPCSECDERFANEIKQRNHMVMKHSGTGPMQPMLEQRKQAGEDPYQCTLCGKAFKNNSILKKHMYKSKSCKLRIRDHIRDVLPLPLVYNVDDEHNYTKKCCQCNKIFSTAEMLKDHMKMHYDAQSLIPELTLKAPS